MDLVFTEEGVCHVCVGVAGAFFISPSQMCARVVESPGLRQLFYDTGILVCGGPRPLSPQEMWKERSSCKVVRVHPNGTCQQKWMQPGFWLGSQ